MVSIRVSGGSQLVLGLGIGCRGLGEVVVMVGTIGLGLDLV